ncbi:MAG: hypothetical protein AABW92_06230 [Nanoarchaeota archaeon]
MQNVNGILNEIFREWIEYKNADLAFVSVIRGVKYFPKMKKQGLFLEAYYALMRGVDNYVDGDVPLKSITPVEFLEDRLTFLEEFQQKPDIEANHQYDGLLKHCMNLGKEFGQEFYQETEDIYRSMLFDARRYGKLEAFSEFDLDTHFFILDIRGTVRGMLKIIGEPLEKGKFLDNLAIATRIYYNIRDLPEDFAAGFLNISRESMSWFGITYGDIEKVEYLSYKYMDDVTKESKEDLLKNYYLSLPDAVKSWIYQESVTGLELLDQHKKLMSKDSFSGFMRNIAFPLIYEKPAREYFEKVIEILE